MNLRSIKASGLGAALLVLAAVGCTDTTVQPKSTVSDANVFNDPNSYRAFLAKIYAGLALSGQQGPAGNADLAGLDEGFSQYLRLYWELQELPTDEAVIAWGDLGLPELNTATWASTNGFVQTMYYRIFYQVALANSFLYQTTDDKLAARSNVTPALKTQIAQYRAEARFLRAFSLWHGLDFFGAIPLPLSVGATPPPQVPRDSIYRFVVSELVAIKDSLPAPGPAAFGRATTVAAHMLLAELYLNGGVYTGTANYAGALTEAQTVISSGAYSLDPNYARMFLADNSSSPEIIFLIPQDGSKEETWGGVTFLVHASCGGGMNNKTYGIDGCWWGLRMKPQADSFFNTTADHPAGDVRAAPVYTNGQTLAVTNISTFTNGYAFPKFQNVTSTGSPGSNATFVDTDFPVFRLGEAYLIYAEANLRGGGGSAATALGYINALRQRAYGGTGGNITGPQLTLAFVLAERGRELTWEAHRRTDLIRFGLFTGPTYLWSWKGNTMAGAATDAHLNLYPLPQTDLVANPNLKQNPGY
jgi:hypothetical protein